MADLLRVIRESWGWTGLDPVEVVDENDFGNVIVRDASGSYWRIVPEDLSCEVVAENRAALDTLSRDQVFLKDWYMESLVADAVRVHGPLEGGRKFFLLTPGPLGGAYDSKNVRTAPVEEVLGLAGDIARQIKDLPDGAKVEIKVVE